MLIEITKPATIKRVVRLEKFHRDTEDLMDKSLKHYEDSMDANKTKIPYKNVRSLLNTHKLFAINIRDAAFNTRSQFVRLTEEFDQKQSATLQMLMTHYEDTKHLTADDLHLVKMTNKMRGKV